MSGLAVGLILFGHLALGSATAIAVSTPTISGPAVVGYYDLVTLTGTTPSPGQAVTVYFGASSTSFSSTRQVVSNTSAQFTLSYREVRATYYYARVGAAKSAVHSTAL